MDMTEREKAKSRVKYPGVRVRVMSVRENPLAVVGRVQRALRGAGLGVMELKKFHDEAVCSRDCDEILSVCARWVSVE